jgi:hypothetical protein
VIVAAMPRVHQERIDSVVTAAIDLNWLSRLAGETVGNTEAEVLLLDAKGTVLAAYPDDHGWVGKNLAWQPDFWGKVSGGIKASLKGDCSAPAADRQFCKLPNTDAILTVLRHRTTFWLGQTAPRCITSLRSRFSRCSVSLRSGGAASNLYLTRWPLSPREPPGSAPAI